MSGAFSKPQRQDLPDIPDNLYMAKIARIQQKTGKESGKPYTSWGFEIVQPPFVKRWVWGNTQPTVSPKSKAGQFLTVLGINLADVDDNWNEQVLIGTYVKVLLITTENDDGDKFQNVDKLLAMTEADQQLLQLWLSQAQVTGPAKVAVQATAPVAAQQPLAPVVTPVQPVAAQPVPVATVPTAQPVAAPVAPARRTGFPF